ncbi:alpha/beta hydrolase [Sphingomonas sp. IC-56]|uniref:alpha/beta fold hydrolase n=1 Tax=Sphingomonas sp. IC-56 TaxID=2898529 RepID=UPI001E5E60F8|nr:alpha/beta hydrolase [Sphingomonas sp. IC-56]MCD2324672.1 alpha/beta hydrolase [Sphingomonas sp. IC-56]
MATSLIDRRALPPGAQVRRWAAQDGWEMRVFDWRSDSDAPRGSILFQGGRGDMAEKYLESLAHWHAQGWHVTSFDWRGQGGSGRCTKAANCGHIDDYGRYVADLAAFYAEWAAATPGPHVVMGHSMGGHVLLRALAEEAIAPDAAVLVAPMLGFRHGIFGPFAERAAQLMGGMGDMARPAWKGNEKPYTTTTRNTLLTHDTDRYSDEIWWQTHQSDLLTGPPSWRWVIEGFKSMRQLAGDPRLERIATPVLMLVATADALVDPRAALRLAPRIPACGVVTFGAESAHEILREVDAVRNRALGEIDAFLAQRAPTP